MSSTQGRIAGSSTLNCRSSSGNIDIMGHVNNATYLQYMETACVELARSLGQVTEGFRPGFIVASARCEFKRSIRNERRITVSVWVSRIGDRSWDLDYSVRGPRAEYAVERAARIADGIMPAAGRSTTIEKLSQTINNFRDMVRRAGRNPEEIMWILRVHNPLDEEKATEPRALLGGTPQQAAKDLPRLKDLGIDHVFYSMNHPAQVPIDTQLLLLRRLMRLIKS